MSLIRQFAIRNELLYSGFVLPNVQIFFVQKISFATFGVSIDDFFTRYAGLGYSLFCNHLDGSERAGCFTVFVFLVSCSSSSRFHELVCSVGL